MQVHDLSAFVDENTSVPPKLPTFRQGSVVRHEESGYESDYITGSTHTGTHMDAPYHFDPDGRRIGDITLSETIQPTKRADVRDVAGPNVEVTLEDVREALPAPLEEGDFLFVHTGWSDEHMNTDGFYGDNPYYAEDIAAFCVEREATGLITDTAIDPADSNYPNHYTLLEADLVIVENVVNCEGLPEEFTTVVAPVRLKNGDGAPARVFAIES